MQSTFTTHTIKEAAINFWKTYSAERVFGFHGVMGSGKTTFIHALCDVKQVKDIVGSPTFSIINEYIFTEDGSERKIFHIDLYRLKDEEEALQAGIEDCLYSDHICFVEWPEKAPGLFPPDTVHIQIEIIDSTTRKLSTT